MAKPVILFYDPTSAPWSGAVKQLCTRQGLRLRPVEPSETGLALSALAWGNAAPVSAPALISEPMLVLCGLSSSQLDRLLAGLRSGGVPVTCLKAVLTPTNQSWSLAALYRELFRERLSMQGLG